MRALRPAFRYQIHQAEIKAGQQRLSAKQQKKHGATNNADRQCRTQITKPDQRPLARSKNSEHHSYHDERDTDHNAPFQRPALFKNPEFSPRRV